MRRCRRCVSGGGERDVKGGVGWEATRVGGDK